jgi:hypothetical protein
MSDVLRMDYINGLPQPFLVRFCGDKEWWPVNDFAVETGLMRIDVVGKLQVKRFSEVMEIRDGDHKLHDPDDFYEIDPIETAALTPAPSPHQRQQDGSGA